MVAFLVLSAVVLLVNLGWLAYQISRHVTSPLMTGLLADLP
jgi:hypothetical protein